MERGELNNDSESRILLSPPNPLILAAAFFKNVRVVFWSNQSVAWVLSCHAEVALPKAGFSA